MQNCFSHELLNFRKFPNFGEKISKIFLTKMFFLTIFSCKDFSLLSGPLHCIKGTCMYLLKFHCKNLEMYKFHCFQDHYTLTSNMYRKIVKKFRMAIPNFFQHFPPKDWYKFGMAKNSHSKFFPTIFSKNTPINLEWPKMAILNFF